MKLLKQLSHELEDLVASAAPAVVGVEHRRGQGTGLILARDGYILTNAHVVHGFDQLRIRLSTGATVKGELVGADDRTDLAVLRVDADGNVLGINTAIIPWAQGIGFAIPSPTASWVAAVLIQSGEVRRPFLGIAAKGEELLPMLSRGAGQVRAVRILGIGEGSPAQAAGLRKGDLLLSANGKSIASVDDLQRVIVLAGLGDVQLEIYRGDERQKLSVS